MTVAKHILVPTDGSEDACKAAAYAGDLARALGARVSVLLVQSEDLIMPHSWGASSGLGGMPAGTMSVDDVRSMLEQRARETQLPETVAALGDVGAEPERVTIWGHPAEEICRYATEHDIDLIVMGSHGRSGLGRVLLGSVSHAVVNQAPCPVTIVR